MAEMTNERFGVMSLLKRNKDKQIAAEKRLVAQHAIVEMGADRNVRDALLQGFIHLSILEVM